MTDHEDIEVVPNPPEPDANTLDAVLVMKLTDEDGTITTNVITNGDIAATEVQTLLELGLKSWRQKIGLV